MNANMEVELKQKELALIREEFKEKELQLQLKMKEMEGKVVECPLVAEKKDAPFDVIHQVQLVPPFLEQEVDKSFLHFEKVAANLHWPMEA